VTAAPLILPPNQFHRFYAGGARIDALRGAPAGEDGRPEDWIGSTTTAFGEESEGLSRVADGRLVRDLVDADPEALLGPEHVGRFGADPGLLVKLLDAGERLPVHVHPGRDFARSHLGSRWGKTEAWLILDAEPGASVHVGLREPIDAATLRRWVDEQDAGEMLAALRELPVRAGDAILFPAGTLHAIGAGILLLELQEPTDFSVLLEWDGFQLSPHDGHLKLGWDRALQALDRHAADPPHAAPTLPDEADPYFRAERISGDARALDAGFSIVVVLDGAGTLGDLPLQRGMAVLIPYGAGETRIEGVEAIRCRPPAPDAGEGHW
jgi:mannose-6-phosphate isomerase